MDRYSRKLKYGNDKETEAFTYIHFTLLAVPYWRRDLRFEFLDIIFIRDFWIQRSYSQVRSDGNTVIKLRS